MHKLLGLILVCLVVIIYGFGAQSAYASLPGDVIISQVQIGDSSSSRFIEIYNNTDSPVDITNWCVYHSSASGITKDELACFKDADKTLHLILSARSYALISSDKFSIPGSDKSSILGDLMMTEGLGKISGGHIYITDDSGVTRDSLGWGDDINPNLEGEMADIPDNDSHVLERVQTSPGIYADTNNNHADFFKSVLRKEYITGAVGDAIDVCLNIPDIQVLVPAGDYIDKGNCLPIPVDLCLNIADIQIVIPAGYLLDISGQCQMDICLNIDGLQVVLPDKYSADGLGNCYPPPPIDVCNNLDGPQQDLPNGMEFDVNGDCVQPDECLNLPGIQTYIPAGFIRGPDNNCLVSLLPLRLNEILPNAIGSDIGHEFIEIYNPNDTDVSLLYYFLYIGPDYEHFYSFPLGSYIEAHQYLSFSNSDIKFTLVNTVSSVRLRAIDGINIDETPVYSNPAEGMAWALIDNVWQYTNRPTPGSVNLPTLIEPKPVVAEKVVTAVSSLQPCAANQYRSVETNRCRLITTTTTSSTVKPCKDGQYRSEETNRCRSIVSEVATLTMCAEGQERNPETNRCRTVSAVLGASVLAPCKAGQERNVDTNRCRNVVSTIPQVAYAPVQTSEPTNNYIGWWSLAGVGAVAVIYGVWEWRQEILNIIRKLGSFRHSGK